MKIILQRVSKASVTVDGSEISAIGKGFLLLVGVSREDSGKEAEALAAKVAKIRVFEDENGKMNLDIAAAGGDVLSVPQFTLMGDTRKGNRPGFEAAGDPGKAKELWMDFNEFLRARGVHVLEGEFGAHMDVFLVNDGPVTFILEA
ncbi:MAG: D-tyrosyl-tRNA(Tyr) deacylase [Candidatus Omnitrophica bacterium]|nr:D-tyrosyl-tRNA(Tyr) deacylase [Candidatus Omnitrophota bacterium]